MVAERQVDRKAGAREGDRGRKGGGREETEGGTERDRVRRNEGQPGWGAFWIFKGGPERPHGPFPPTPHVSCCPGCRAQRGGGGGVDSGLGCRQTGVLTVQVALADPGCVLAVDKLVAAAAHKL